MQFSVPSSQFLENPCDEVQVRTETRKLRTSCVHKSSRGYIFITLMLFMTLVTMAALAVLPEIVQQIKRDREEEMVHRGTEYMRAIKKYYKKFGRYPTKIEDLENTNQQRFLRKRYKDPLAGKDFKIIRVGDPALNMLGMGGIGRGIGPGIGPGQNAGLAQSFAQGGAQLLAQAGAQGLVGAAGGGVRPAGPDDANTPQVTGLPGQQGGAQPAAGADSDNAGAKPQDSASDSASGPGGQVFGGGPILGVASTSKAKTIREFNKKNHYNEWLFVYDPNSDRSGLLKGPIQPDANRGAGIGGGIGTGVGGGLGGNGIAAPPPAQQPGQSVMTPQSGAPPGGQQEPPDQQ